MEHVKYHVRPRGLTEDLVDCPSTEIVRPARVASLKINTLIQRFLVFNHLISWVAYIGGPLCYWNSRVVGILNSSTTTPYKHLLGLLLKKGLSVRFITKCAIACRVCGGGIIIRI